MKNKIHEAPNTKFGNSSTASAKTIVLNERILNEIDRQFEFAEKTKDDVLFVRYDIRFPEGSICKNGDRVNGAYRAFQSKFIKNLSRHGLEPQYVAVREESADEPPHYHVALMLDGRKAQTAQEHIQTAERLWESTLGLPARENGYGLIRNCTTDHDGKMLPDGLLLRNDDSSAEQKRNDCVSQANQLAKSSDKGMAPKWQREFFSSRLP